MNRILGLFAGGILSLSLALPAAAEPANLLGVFGNWSAYTTGSGSSQTCYALSRPRASRPYRSRFHIRSGWVSLWGPKQLHGQTHSAIDELTQALQPWMRGLPCSLPMSS